MAEAGTNFFSNRACEYFPCHKGIDSEDFNCLLCYCPLYALGPHCGGDFTYTPEGRKDCAGCTLPHQGESGMQMVFDHYGQLADLAKLEQ